MGVTVASHVVPGGPSGSAAAGPRVCASVVKPRPSTVALSVRHSEDCGFSQSPHRLTACVAPWPCGTFSRRTHLAKRVQVLPDARPTPRRLEPAELVSLRLHCGSCFPDASPPWCPPAGRLLPTALGQASPCWRSPLGHGSAWTPDAALGAGLQSCSSRLACHCLPGPVPTLPTP